MTQLELADLAKKISKMYFEPWHSRYPAIIKPSEFGGSDNAYGQYILNDWIPAQRDAANLMKLLLMCQRDLAIFFGIIVSPPPGKKSSPIAA